VYLAVPARHDDSKQSQTLAGSIFPSERMKDSGLGFAEPGAQGHERLRNRRTGGTT